MLVSAIMPTRSRPLLSQTAVQCFLSQSWREKELVILDDEDDPSFSYPSPFEFHAGPATVRYYRGPQEFIGVKREKLCNLAKGEVIIHFDSDDWSDPGRITEQVDLLVKSGKPMSGYHSLLFWDMRNSVGYLWKGPEGFACGTSMCYTREFWKSHRWPPIRVASDNQVVYAAQKDGGIATLDGRQMCVARAHTNNTSSAARIGQNAWPKVQDSAFSPEFFAALDIERLRA